MEIYLTVYGTFTAKCNENGLRAWKQVGSTKTFFLYDGTDLVGEFTATGTVKATNTFGVNGLVYRRVGSLSTYYAFDPMGNAVNTTDQGGYTLADAGYDAYGTRTSDAGARQGFGRAAWGGLIVQAGGRGPWGRRFERVGRREA